MSREASSITNETNRWRGVLIWGLLSAIVITAVFWRWIDGRLDAIPIRPALFGVLAVPTYTTAFFGAAFVLCLALALFAQVLLRATRRQGLDVVPFALSVGILLLAAVAAWRPLTSERRARAAESSDLRYDQAEDLLQWAVGNRDLSVIKALALNHVTPPAMLDEIARLDWPDLRRPGLGFQDVLRSDLRSTKRILAQREDLPPSALVHLAADPATDIVSAAAHNPSTPPEVLESLAQAHLPAVRSAVASNPAAPPTTLQSLARDADPGVRLGVAQNDRTPRTLLETLAQDLDPRVRASATKRLTGSRAAAAALLKGSLGLVQNGNAIWMSIMLFVLHVAGALTTPESSGNYQIRGNDSNALKLPCLQVHAIGPR